MTITVIPAGIFRIKCPALPAQLQLEFTRDSVSIDEVLADLVARYGEESLLEALVAVNHILIQDNASPMYDGDCLHLFSPAFGG